MVWRATVIVLIRQNEKQLMKMTVINIILHSRTEQVQDEVRERRNQIFLKTSAF